MLSWHNLAAFSNLRLRNYPNYDGIFGKTYPGGFLYISLSKYLLNSTTYFISTICCGNEFYRVHVVSKIRCLRRFGF